MSVISKVLLGGELDGISLSVVEEHRVSNAHADGAA